MAHFVGIEVIGNYTRTEPLNDISQIDIPGR